MVRRIVTPKWDKWKAGDARKAGTGALEGRVG